MSEREYIVSLKKGVDYDQFWDQVENTSADDGFVPTRRVDIVNNRDGSLRSCHYALSDSEAETLRSDPRVYSVEIPPDQRKDVRIGFYAQQAGFFRKTVYDDGVHANWGLARCNYAEDPYSPTNTLGPSMYNYNLDGTGVDVVIHDSGLQVDHPEFTDGDGNSRLQLINWYTESGLPGTQSIYHNRDFHGHGTHVGGTAAGKTYGWAKNARIYNLKVNGLEGAGDAGNGIPIGDCFDVVKLWHRNKPIDPITGHKRPTIVNMSWGYSQSASSITGGNYRGNNWLANDPEYTTSELLWQNAGIVPPVGFFGRSMPVRISSVDADLEELIDEGVHVCIAAGNNFYKIDASTGPDYNNYITTSTPGELKYYHRGSSPYSEQAFMVGNIDSQYTSNDEEQKASSSCAGPGVDIYAPGTDIMSSSSTQSEMTQGIYPYNSDFYVTNITGTSMASPQVCGAGALVLQLNPQFSPSDLKSFLNTTAKTNQIYNGESAVDYNNTRSLYGGSNRYLYNKFNSSKTLSIFDPNNPPAEVIYNLTANKTTVDEGSSVVVTLTTSGLSNGTRVPYTIGGVTQSDIVNNLQGIFVIENNTASVTIYTTSDSVNEPDRTLFVKLDNNKAITGLVLDDDPYYTISQFPDRTIIEGEDVIITVNAYNVPDEVVLYYSMSGTINTFDLAQPLSGVFGTLVDGTVTRTFNTIRNGGDSGNEYAFFYIRTGSTSGPTVATTTIVIEDLI